MPLTLPRQAQQKRADEQATLVVLPLSMRSNRAGWLHRSCHLVCHAQRDNELVAVVLQGADLHLIQGKRIVPISSPTSAELHQLMAAWPENGYAHLQVTLAVGAAGRVPSRQETSSVSAATPTWSDGAIKPGSQATVVVKTRRKMATQAPSPTSPDIPPHGPSRPPQVFRLPATAVQHPPGHQQILEADSALAFPQEA